MLSIRNVDWINTRTSSLEMGEDGNSTQLISSSQHEMYRLRWTSRLSFVLAAVGAAIGLGNFWRFPFLVYKHGGGVFLIPYTIALFTLGIPMLQLEVSLGQIIQGGNLRAFYVISPMMMGIGLASAVTAFIIVSYYVTILAWILMYIVQSFQSNLQWSQVSPCTFQQTYVSNAHYYFYHQVLGVWETMYHNVEDHTCLYTLKTESIQIQWETFGYTVIAWIVIYFCVWKGANHTSKIVYVTVLLPIILLIIMMFRVLTLDGASMGIKAYITKWELHILRNSEVWVDAVSQVFFSLSLSAGIMTSFGSYNRRNKPILSDTIIIVFCNFLFSFISGLVVMASLGFYAKHIGTTIDSLPANSIESLELIFVTYPTVLHHLTGTKFWSIVLFVNLFFLGIDSAFAIVEGYQACIEDTQLTKYISRPFLLCITMIPCALLSIVYCQDTGIHWFNIIDHYTQYALILVGGMQCVAVGWIRGTYILNQVFSKTAPILFASGYVIGLLTFIIITVFLSPIFGMNIVGILLGNASLFIICFSLWYLAYRQTNWPIGSWLETCILAGPYTFVKYWMEFGAYWDGRNREIVPLGKGIYFKDTIMHFYGRYWTIMIKYIVPLSSSFLLFAGIYKDIQIPYNNLDFQYQLFGWLFLIVILLLMLLPPFFLNAYPNPKIDICEIEPERRNICT